MPGARNSLITWPAAILVSAAVACAIGSISLRTSGISFIMITLAFAQMLYFLFVSLQAYGGDDGLRFTGAQRLHGAAIDRSTMPTIATLLLSSASPSFALSRCSWQPPLVRLALRHGAARRRENERRMRALGFPTFRYKLAAFVIAGAVGGLAGALLANLTEFVGPSTWTGRARAS